MKVRSNQKDEDLLCHKSLAFLSERLDRFFENHYPGQSTWYPDDSVSPSHGADGPVHVVLYGNFLRDIIESESWPGDSFKIWVLSEQVKLCLTEILNIPSDQISIVPRKLLLSEATDSEAVPGKRLVYGGRLSRQKNILDLLLTCAFLQLDHDKDYELELLGNVDNAHHEDHGRFNFAHSFQKVIEQYLESIPWTKEVSVTNDLNSEEWLTKAGPDSTFISLSKFHMEDFGVSVAQCIEKGIPSLITSWAGYNDYDSPLVSHLQNELSLGHSFPLGLRAAAARKMAEAIHSNSYIKAKTSPQVLGEPEVVSKADLSNIRSEIFKQLGSEQINIPRDKTSLFADGPTGKKYFHKLRSIYSCTEPSQKQTIIITTQLGRESILENQALFHFAYKNLNQETNSQFLILDSVSSASKESMTSLLNAPNVFCTNDLIKNYPMVIEHLNNLGIDFVELEAGMPLPLNLSELNEYI